MDYKKLDAPREAITRDIDSLVKQTGNIYEVTSILSKRANQISSEIKDELDQKLKEFASYTDNLEEVFENREQIEISKYYEALPKSTLFAVQEFIEGNVYYRIPKKEQDELEEGKDTNENTEDT